MGDLITVKEASKILGVTERTVYTYISSGKFPVIRINRKQIRIDKDDLTDFLMKHKETK